MKLLSIYADNYGVFHGRHVDFRDQLQVIYGPNEAGKSTLLQLIRESLFGFPHRSPYSWRSSSKMAATIRMELRNGQRVQFRRQKGKPDDVNGSYESSSVKIQSDADVAALLSGANKETFTNIFGFSLEELTAGQNSLKDSGLGDLLLTGGVQGLDQFRFMEKEIAEQQAEIFASRAKTRKVNVVLDELTSAKKRYQEQRIAPQEFDALIDQRRTRQSRVDELQQDLLTLRQQEERLAKYLKALPLSRSLELLREEISQLKVPESLSPSTCKELEALLDKHEVLTTDVEDVQTALTAAGDSSNQCDIDEELLNNKAEVQRLVRETQKIRNFLSEQSAQTAEQQHLYRDITQRLKDLGAEWTLERVRNVSTSVPFREQIQDLAERRNELDKSLAQLESRAPDIEQQLAQVQRELEDLPTPRSIVGLEDLLERSESYLRDVADYTDTEQTLAATERELTRLSRELGSPLGLERTDWEILTVPLKSTIQDWQDRIALAKQKYTRAVDQVNDKQELLKEHQISLAEFDQLHPSLDRDRLIQQRKHRDLGIDLLIQQFDDANTNENTPLLRERVADWLADHDSKLSDELVKLIAETDHLADLQYMQAEIVAKRDQLVHRIEITESQIAELNEAESNAKQQLQELEAGWDELWTSAEFTPLSPTEMLEWLQTFEQYQLKVQSLEEIQARVSKQQESIAAFDQELARTFPKSDASPKSALKAAHKELQAAQRTTETNARLQRDQAQLSLKAEEIESQRFELSLKIGEFENQQRSLFKKIGFPEEWSLIVAQRVMGMLIDVQRDLHALDEIGHTNSHQQQEIDTFQTATKELLSKLGQELVGDSCDVIDSLYETLQETQRIQQEQLQSAATHDEKQRQLSHLKSQLSDITKSLATRCEELGVEGILEIKELLEISRQQKGLLIEQQQQEKALRLEAANFETLRQEFGTEETELNAQRTELELQIERSENDYRTALKDQGAVQHQIDQLTLRNAQQSSAGELSHHRARLNELVQKWSALTLSQRVMRQAQQRYENENRPEMMRVVSDYLSRMTLGRYVKIQSDHERKKDIVIVEAEGETKLPNELSTGTREQLYLAVRLGYLSHYSESHEPLPLVMDDVLVNFDDERAMQTLKVLHECSVEHQVLLLTCHKRTVDMMKQLNSEARILELVPGSLEGQQEHSPLAPRLPNPAKKKRQEDDHAQPALFPNA